MTDGPDDLSAEVVPQREGPRDGRGADDAAAGETPGDREKKRASNRRYAQRHADRLREARKRWKESNPDKVKEHKSRYRAAHLEQIRADGRERERERNAQKREEKQRAEAKREYARQWYAQNRERHLNYQRQYHAAQKANDPDAYRAAVRERNRKWRDSHREQENAKLRAKYRDDPDVKAKRAANYYKTHTDEVRARRRAYYAANREKERATQDRYRAREKRRKEAGLPPRQVHRTPREQRLVHTAAADAFFARPRTWEERAAVRKELATPPELHAEWMRDCKRARAAHQFAEEKELRARLGIEDRPRPTAQQIEEARIDAIAKEVNDRLRRADPPRRVQRPDPAAPHPMLQHTSQMGMNR